MMGFLDRMISDLIQDNTGINARRLVRKIGGGKLLAMGGAAIAASVLADKHGMLPGQKTPSTGQAPGTVPGAPQAPAASQGPPETRSIQRRSSSQPPPPPIPGSQPAPPQPAAPPPPLPGAVPETSATPAEDEDELPQELTYAIVRTMVAAALADGKLAPEEKAMIQKHLGDSGLSAEQTSQIHKDLVLPPSPTELAAMTDDLSAREVLYRFGALVVLADQETAELERGWLERLAAAFELDPERRTALESELFSTDEDQA